MAQFHVIYWKDIPPQVGVSDQGKWPIVLPDRFQVELDRIGIQERLVGTDEYLSHWRWSPKKERPESAEEVVHALIRELDTGVQPPQF